MFLSSSVGVPESVGSLAFRNSPRIQERPRMKTNPENLLAKTKLSVFAEQKCSAADDSACSIRRDCWICGGRISIGVVAVPVLTPFFKLA